MALSTGTHYDSGQNVEIYPLANKVGKIIGCTVRGAQKEYEIAYFDEKDEQQVIILLDGQFGEVTS